MVDHIDGGGKEGLDVGIASGIGEAFGQEGFTRTRIANENNIHVSAHKVEVEQIEDARFLLLPGLVVAEVELINGEFVSEFGLPPSQGNGVLKTLLELGIGQSAQSAQEIEIVRFGMRHDGVELVGHACEAQVDEFAFEVLSRAHAFLLFMTKVSNSARDGSSRRIWLRCCCLSLTGGCSRCGVIS